MSQDLPLFIDPAKLAVTDEHLAGHASLLAMPRLCELVLDQKGEVAYSLAFNKDEQGVIRITGEISVVLNLLCQRCLNEMELKLDALVNIGFMRSGEQAELLPDIFEPYITEEKEISLYGLIEDEVILAMPLSPLHNREKCPALKLTQGHAVKRENPFAVLKDFGSKK